MLRRLSTSQDLRYSYEANPRKSRSVKHSNYFQPSIYWKGSRGIYTPISDTFGANWKGKVFIPYRQDEPWQIARALRKAGRSMQKNQYALEYEIMRNQSPNVYRIIRADHQGNWRSKFAVEYRPQRLNIILSPTDIILDVLYF